MVQQGQEGPAEAVLDKYMKEGGWVFLDNVHLMQGWIPTLERKLEAAAENAHPDFRCFFSAEPINGAPQVRMPPAVLLLGRDCWEVQPSQGSAGSDLSFTAWRQDMAHPLDVQGHLH